MKNRSYFIVYNVHIIQGPVGAVAKDLKYTSNIVFHDIPFINASNASNVLNSIKKRISDSLTSPITPIADVDIVNFILLQDE